MKTVEAVTKKILPLQFIHQYGLPGLSGVCVDVLMNLKMKTCQEAAKIRRATKWLWKGFGEEVQGREEAVGGEG